MELIRRGGGCVVSNESGICILDSLSSIERAPPIHSSNMQPHFTPDFTLNLVNVAHYTSQIQHKI